MNTLELIHAKIHGLRMMGSKYKPSVFETEVNLLIAEEFSQECTECAKKAELLNLQLKLKDMVPQQPKESFLAKIGRMIP